MSVDVEKARAYLRNAPPGAAAAVAFCGELLTEIEQLRADNESYKASNVRLIREGNELRAGLESIVADNVSFSESDGRYMCDICGMWSTKGEAGNHDVCCPIRAALRLLGKEKETK